MANFIYKQPTNPDLSGYYCIVLSSGNEQPILNRLANPNYLHYGRRVFLTDEEREELQEFVRTTGRE